MLLDLVTAYLPYKVGCSAPTEPSLTDMTIPVFLIVTVTLITAPKGLEGAISNWSYETSSLNTGERTDLLNLFLALLVVVLAGAKPAESL